MRPPAELGNISCFIVLKNSLKINESLLRRIVKKFGMKVMKNHGTLNGTLKNDNMTNNELTLLASFFPIRAYPYPTPVTGWEYLEGPFQESSHRFRTKESSRERNPKSRGAGKSSNSHLG